MKMLDPLVADVVEVNWSAEGQAREDRHLGSGVAAAHVVAWICLGVPAALRLGKSLGVAGALRHLGEDVVRGPVDDPVDAVDGRRRERFLEHAHDRHDAGDGGLEAQAHAPLARRLEQLLSVL